MAKLIKIDRNGSKHYEGFVKCDRCDGRGWFAIGVNNGELIPSHVDNAVCYKCYGEGVVYGKWIERTPEYEAKLEARRQKKEAERRAKLEAERKERKAEQEAARAELEARKAEEEARKAVSQYMGQVGEKLNIKATFEHMAWFERRSFAGYGMETVYIYNFRDADGNLLIWKTTGGQKLQDGEIVNLTGTVKEHTEYRGEKQTILTRCRIKAER